MAFTFQSIMDLARIPLNDKDKTRYTDETMLTFTNHALLQLGMKRPDLFIGQFGSMPTGENLASDAFPLPPSYLLIVADYITSRAEMTDDEHVNSGRALAFLKLIAPEIGE